MTHARHLHRTTDPGPSGQAARQHVASGAHGKQTQLVYELLLTGERMHGRGCTGSELEAIAATPEWRSSYPGKPLDRYTIIKRLNDLRHRGNVANEPAITCSATKRAQTTWVTVRQAKLALIHSVKGQMRITRRNLEQALEVATKALGFISRDPELRSAQACAKDALDRIKAIEAGGDATR